MRHILITGGTGTLGKALIERLYEDNFIHVLSRDENKQKALKREYPQVMCHVGDVCDREDLHRISHWTFTHVFHCAASKHIEICEENVSKCVKVNYEGTKNVYHVLGRFCEKFVFFTTDKAVAPINAYGYSKALAEKYLQEPANKNVWIFRWGNILGSTGSVLSLFVNAIKKDKPVYVTSKDMTRFWLTINSATKYVLDTIKQKKPGSYWPPFIKSATLPELIKAIESIIGNKAIVKTMGLRAGEKIHEAMEVNEYGVQVSSETCKRFEKDELKALIGGLL